jgi:hypothetical protein
MRLGQALLTVLPLATFLSCRVTPVAAVDVAVLAVDLHPAPAGQPSDARVTVANRGTRSLQPQDYLIRIDAPGTAEELRQNACGDQRLHVFVDAPVTIEPGTTEVVTVHHIFARAGTYAITVTATLELLEDGATADDTLTSTATVPPSLCCDRRSVAC